MQQPIQTLRFIVPLTAINLYDRHRKAKWQFAVHVEVRSNTVNHRKGSYTRPMELNAFIQLRY